MSCQFLNSLVGRVGSQDMEEDILGDNCTQIERFFELFCERNRLNQSIKQEYWDMGKMEGLKAQIRQIEGQMAEFQYRGLNIDGLVFDRANQEISEMDTAQFQQMIKMQISQNIEMNNRGYESYRNGSIILDKDNQESRVSINPKDQGLALSQGYNSDFKKSLNIDIEFPTEFLNENENILQKPSKRSKSQTFQHGDSTFLQENQRKSDETIYQIGGKAGLSNEGIPKFDEILSRESQPEIEDIEEINEPQFTSNDVVSSFEDYFVLAQRKGDLNYIKETLICPDGDTFYKFLLSTLNSCIDLKIHQIMILDGIRHLIGTINSVYGCENALITLNKGDKIQGIFQRGTYSALTENIVIRVYNPGFLQVRGQHGDNILMKISFHSCLEGEQFRFKKYFLVQNFFDFQYECYIS